MVLRLWMGTMLPNNHADGHHSKCKILSVTILGARAGEYAHHLSILVDTASGPIALSSRNKTKHSNVLFSETSHTLPSLKSSTVVCSK